MKGCKYIEILKINVEMHSEELHNDFQYWIFEEEKTLLTSPRIISFSSVVLTLPNVAALEYSSSCCGVP